MLRPLSATAFDYNGRMVDTVALKFAHRNCGGGKIHEAGNALCVLAALADEVYRGLVVSDREVEWALKRLERAGIKHMHIGADSTRERVPGRDLSGTGPTCN